MKRIIVSLVLIVVCQYAIGQESFHDHRKSVEVDKLDATTPTEGFDWRKVFAGGGISLGYGTTTNGDNSTNSTFNIGAIPEVGYSLTDMFDLGIATSINYYSTVYSYPQGTQKNVNYSLGAFGRIHPLENVFIQFMPERDWINIKTSYLGSPEMPTRYQSTSYLVGVGYGHRIIGQSYFYTLLMLDLGHDYYSPYLVNGQPLPILRGGFNFYPFRKNH